MSLHDAHAGLPRDDVGRVDASWAAALFAVDPAGLGGVALRAGAGPCCERWLASLIELLPAGAPLRRVPLHVGDERLLGGLDLAATLQAGRPIAQRGVLAEADGGVILLAMAERLSPATAARIAAVLDAGEVAVERDGLAERRASRFGVVALDEGIAADETVAPRLLERLAFPVALDEAAGNGTGLRDVGAAMPWTRADIAAARARLGSVEMRDDIVEALCAAALALGIASVRAPWLAWRAARAAAALDGRSRVDEDDAALAARLVLGPRATRLPAGSAEPEPAESEATEPEESASPDLSGANPEASASPPASPDAPDSAGDADTAAPADPLDDLVLEAAVAAIPPGLLAALVGGTGPASRGGGTAGRAGAVQHSLRRGRPNGVRRGEPRAGARLNVLETLRAAAPWQAIRRRESAARGASASVPAAPGPAPRIEVRRDDFHVTRYKQRSETTTIFVVDASGSAALHRLAEAKGAVELLLADCYVRRDSVAVLAFRGPGAELLLPPTRSLVRAKRSLAGLPGGGGTPLAAGIDAARLLADAQRRRGNLPVIVLLTDGRANVARDGQPGRQRAAADAVDAARALRAAGLTALWLDTSPQPQEVARELARDMGALYMPLPHAGAARLSQAVRALAG